MTPPLSANIQMAAREETSAKFRPNAAKSSAPKTRLSSVGTDAYFLPRCLISTFGRFCNLQPSFLGFERRSPLLQTFKSAELRLLSCCLMVAGEQTRASEQANKVTSAHARAFLQSEWTRMFRVRGGGRRSTPKIKRHFAHARRLLLSNIFCTTHRKFACKAKKLE